MKGEEKISWPKGKFDVVQEQSSHLPLRENEYSIQWNKKDPGEDVTDNVSGNYASFSSCTKKDFLEPFPQRGWKRKAPLLAMQNKQTKIFSYKDYYCSEEIRVLYGNDLETSALKKVLESLFPKCLF